MFRVHRQRQVTFVAFLIVAFLFRLWYGLCSQFVDSDTTQIYLLGLKFYTTRAWPYFGPDVIWGETQIAGGLQALLVGAPLFILAIPEAPYILLNLISFGSLSLLAWYSCKRLPELPKWFVWTWLMTAPWVLNLSTVIYNPSYVLAGGVVFFVGLLELLPATNRKVIPVALANFMMGFALVWVMQLHMSWVLLVPFLFLALFFQARINFQALFRASVSLVLGALAPGVLLLPTFLKYGVSGATGQTLQTVKLNLSHWSALPGILTRLLSFASLEIPRFLGAHTADRLTFLKQEVWLTPFAVFLSVVGVAQVGALLVFWFRRSHQHRDWPAIKYLMLATVILAYISFFFSVKPPQSNHLYVALPLVMIYSLYCWSRLLTNPRWQMFAKIVLACGVVFHIGVAVHNRSRISIYTQRAKVQSAINNKDYSILAERRPGTLY